MLPQRSLPQSHVSLPTAADPHVVSAKRPVALAVDWVVAVLSQIDTPAIVCPEEVERRTVTRQRHRAGHFFSSVDGTAFAFRPVEALGPARIAELEQRRLRLV